MKFFSQFFKKFTFNINTLRKSDFAIRFLTTAMSVTLAFLVDRSYENYRVNSQFKQALQDLHSQNTENIVIIDSAIADQHRLRAILNRLQNDSSISLMNVASRPPYINTASLKNIALTRFLNNPNVDFDFDLASKLADLENTQKDLNDINQLINKTLWQSETNSTGHQAFLQKTLMINLTGSAIYAEKCVKKSYSDLEDYMAKKGIIQAKN